jgi:hypothetical protein
MCMDEAYKAAMEGCVGIASRADLIALVENTLIRREHLPAAQCPNPNQTKPASDESKGRNLSRTQRTHANRKALDGANVAGAVQQPHRRTCESMEHASEEMNAYGWSRNSDEFRRNFS